MLRDFITIIITQTNCTETDCNRKLQTVPKYRQLELKNAPILTLTLNRNQLPLIGLDHRANKASRHRCRRSVVPNTKIARH